MWFMYKAIVTQRTVNCLAKVSQMASTGVTQNDEEIWDLIPPERTSLKKLRQISIRNKSWFRMLSWTQRRFIDATIVVTERIRSLLMLRVLAPLVRKLLEALGENPRNGFLALMSEGAYKIAKNAAEKIVQTAQRWGNKSAPKWLDYSFIRFLMVMNLSQDKNPTLLTS
ncbi:MAG: hypothetical protein QXG97_07760 [Nitrososphaerota archaeon]